MDDSIHTLCWDVYFFCLINLPKVAPILIRENVLADSITAPVAPVLAVLVWIATAGVPAITMITALAYVSDLSNLGNFKII